MEEKQFQDLLDRYGRNECTKEEKQRVEAWLTFGDFSLPKNAGQLEKIHLRQLDHRLKLNLKQKSKTRRLWPVYTGSAAAIILVLFGLYFTLIRDKVSPSDNQTVSVINDIRPGRSGATLTLSSGTTIPLDGDKTGLIIQNRLTYQDGSELKNPEWKNENSIQTITASTAKGQTYSFTLPDGSKVWLNAASKISFPSRFDGSERMVSLSGEAYFEVAKDKAHPFIVTSQNTNLSAQRVEVLGTHFNINAYSDENAIRTSLAEGSVKVIAEKQTLLLKPGQQSEFAGTNSQQSLRLKPANLEEVLAWKDGRFTFSGARIQDIMKQLSRWYDVEIGYEGNITSETFSGSITRDLNASEALGLLHFAGVKFRIEGKKITVVN